MIQSFPNFFWPLVFFSFMKYLFMPFCVFFYWVSPRPPINLFNFNILDISYFSVIHAANNSLHSVFSHSL